MCDCFHLAFPNWHGSPGTGAGRRLKGPEPSGEDDSTGEEAPEFLEEERPRPQGSSPVNEFPAAEKFKEIEKQTEEEPYDPYHKSSCTKKAKRVGFGSFFERRSPVKMSQTEVEGSEPGVIVKTVKEACAEGMVVSGGGKDGIFIKEVKPESPASKHLGVHEGDQILSATVYFDNVTYEDALQILEHAQAYKMELCLKRRQTGSSEPVPNIQETLEQEGGSASIRGRSKTQRRPDARISWPKFPSFSRGRKTPFRRSHSTSDAEEQKKLEISPTTSDTESPVKSQETVKGKAKRQKMKLSKIKARSLQSKSEEQDEQISMEIVEKETKIEDQTEIEKSEVKKQQESFAGEVTYIHMLDEKKKTQRMKTECTFACAQDSLPEKAQHKAELISLDKTLKTTDITEILVHQGLASPKRSPDGKKRKKERSELKVNIQGKEKEDTSPEIFLKSHKDMPVKTFTKSQKATDKTVMGLHQSKDIITTKKERLLDTDVNKQKRTSQTLSCTVPGGDMDIIMPIDDYPLDMSGISLLHKSTKTEPGKQWKERSILISDLERYGIQNKHSTADVNSAKSTIASPRKEVNTSTAATSRSIEPFADTETIKCKAVTDLKSIKPIENIKSSSVDSDTMKGSQDSKILIDLEQPEIKAIPSYKLPKTDLVDFGVHEHVEKTEVNVSKVPKSPKVQFKVPKVEQYFGAEQIQETRKTDLKILPNREDIDIPGMEVADSLVGLKTSDVKDSKTQKTQPAVLSVDIQMQVINVDNMKAASSKTDISQYSLPKVDSYEFELIRNTDANAEKTKSYVKSSIAQQNILLCEVKPQVLPIEGETSEADIKHSIITTKTEKSAKIPLSSYKLPNVGLGQDTHKPITMTTTDSLKASVVVGGLEGTGEKMKNVLKREDLEIPGMEATTENNITMTQFILPPIHKFHKSEDTAIKIPKVEVSGHPAHEEITKTEAKRKTLVKNMKGPAMEIPTVQLPNIDISHPKVKGSEIDVKGQTVVGDIPGSLPVGTSTPKVTVEIPELKPDIKLPKTETPSGKMQVEIGAMSIEGDVDFQASASGEKSKFQMPHIKMPSFGFSKPDISISKPEFYVPEVSAKGGSVDVKLPESEIKDGATLPSVDIKDPSAEVEGFDLDVKAKVDKDGQGSKFRLPNFGFSVPKIKGSEADMSKPKAEVELPSVEVDLPSAEARVVMPEVDVKGADGNITKPGISFPKFGFSKSDMKAPEVDVNLSKDISIPEATIEIKGPEVKVKSLESEAEITDKTVGVGGSPSKYKLPTIKLPKFGTSTPKVTAEIPELKSDIKLPETDTPTGKKMQVEIGAPDMDIDAKDLKLDKSKVKTEIPKVKMAAIDVSLPKIKGSEIDLKGQTVEGDISVSLPEAEMTITSIEGDVDFQASASGERSKFQMPHIKMPSFGFSKPDISISKPEFNVPEVSAKGVSVDVKLPKSEVKDGATLPSVDIKDPNAEVEGFDLDVKAKVDKDGQGSKFRLPNFGFSVPKIKGSEADMSKPKAEVELPSVEVDLPSAEARAVMPEVDVKGADRNITKRGISFPKFGFSKSDMKAPEVDVNLSKDISIPEATIEIKGPEVKVKSLESEAEITDKTVGVGGSPSKYKLPTIKLPKFGTSTPKVTAEIPELKSDIKLPETDTPTGKMQVEIGAPDMDIDAKDLKLDKSKVKTEIPKVKMPAIDVSLSKIKGSEIDLKGQTVEGDISVPLPEAEMTIMSIEGDVDFQASASGEKSKFQMPHIKMPSFGFSKPDISISKPEFYVPEVSAKGVSVDVKFPKSEIKDGATLPSVDIKDPSAEVEGFDLDVKAKVDKDGQGSKFRLPKFGISVPKIKGSEADMSKPKAEVELPSVEVDLPSAEARAVMPEVDVKGADRNITKRGISFPKFGFSKSDMKAPEVDVNLSKDISIPEATIEIKGPEVKVKSLESEAEITDKTVGVGGSPSKYKLPTIKLPKFGTSTPKVTAEIPELKSDIKLPETDTPSGKKMQVEIGAPDMDIDAKDLKLDKSKVKTEIPKVKMPAIDVSLPKIKGSEIDLKGQTVEGDISVSLPEAEMTITSIEGDVDFQASESGERSKFQMPHIKMPSFGFSKPDISISKPEFNVPEVSAKGVSVDVKFPKSEIKDGATLPSVDIKDPSAEVEGFDLDVKAKVDKDGQGSKFRLPKFGISVPKIKGSEADMSKPKAEVELPSVEVDLPSAEARAVMPEVDVKGADRNITKRGISFPKFGFSKSDMKAPEVDVNLSKDISIPEATIEIKGPEVKVKSLESEAEITDKTVGVGGSPSKYKLPTIKLPKFGTSTPKVTAEIPELKSDIKLPETDTPSGKKMQVEIGAPDMDIDAKDLKLDKSKVKTEIPKVKMPAIDVSLPKIKGSEIDLKGQTVEGDISVSLPEAEMTITSIEGDVDFQASESGERSKFQMPHIKMPSFGFSKPDISISKPEFNVPEVSAKGVSVDVKFPKSEIKDGATLPSVDIKDPSAEVEGFDLDVKAKVDKDGQGSKFRLPKFGISVPKIKGSEADMSKPKAEVELPSVEVDLPSVEARAVMPEVDVKGADRNITKRGISFPKFGFSKSDMKAPEVDVNLSKDISIPEATIEIKGPEVKVKSLESEAEITDKTVGVGGSPSKYKLPTIKLPKFGTSTPKVTAEIPELKSDIKLPETDTPSGKKMQVEIGAPDMDIDAKDLKLDKSKVKTEIPKVKMPAIDVSLPKIKGSEIDLKGQTVEGDISVSLPEAEMTITSIKGDVDFQASESGERSKFQMPHIKMPSFGFSKPDISISKPEFNVPEVSAKGVSVDVKLPKSEIKDGATLPSVDIKDPSAEVEGFDLDVKAKVDKDGQGSKFRLPNFGFSVPKIKGSEADMSKPKAEVELPSVEVDLPSAEARAVMPEVDVKGADRNITKRGISFPKFGFSKSDMKAPEVDVNLSKDISIPEATIEIKGPEVKVKSLESEAEITDKTVGVGGSPSKYKLPTIKLPKFGTSTPKVTAEIPELKSDIKLPETDTPSGKKMQVEIGAPDMDIDAKDLKLDKSKVKTEIPKVKMAAIDVSLPKIKGSEIDLKGQTVEGDISVPLPEAEMTITSIEGDVDFQASASGERSKFQMPHIKMPSFGFSKPDISISKPEFNVPEVSAKGVSVDVNLPESEIKDRATLPSVDIKDPSAEVEGFDLDVKAKVDKDGQGSKFRLPNFGFSVPKIKGSEADMSKPKAEVELPSVEVDLPSAEARAVMPEVDVKGADRNITKRGISFPKFGFSKSDMKAPEVDVNLSKDISIPEATIEIKGPEVKVKSLESEAEITDKTVGVGGSPSKYKLPTIKLPKFGTSTPKVTAEIPELKSDIKLPETDTPSGKKMQVEIGAPDMDIDAKDLKLDKSKVKTEIPKVKMPAIDVSLPKIKGSEIDLKGQTVEGDISVSLPEAEMTITSIEGDVDFQASESGERSKFQMPHIKMPSFGFSKPDISISKPEFNVPEVSAKGVSVDVKLPKSEIKDGATLSSVDIKDPSAEVEGFDLDVKAKVDKDGQGSKFRLPNFGFSVPKIKGSEADMSKPKAEVELPSVEVDLPSAEARAVMPEVDVKGADRNITKRGISFPKFGFSKSDMKAPEVDVNLSKDISIPEATIEIKGPEVKVKSLESEAEITDKTVGVGGSPSKYKLPTIKLPKFGTSTPKVTAEIPELKSDIKLPETDTPTGKMQVEIGAPDMDIDAKDLKLDKSKVKTEIPKVKMPAIDVSLPKIKGSEIDLKGQTVEGDISVPLPEAEMTITSIEGDVDFQASASGEKSKFQMPHIKMPSFGFSKPDISISKPEFNVPEVSAKGVSVDVNLPESEIKDRATLPSVDIKDPSAEVEGFDLDVKAKVDKDVQECKEGVKEADRKITKRRISFPKFGFSKSEIKAPEVELNLSKDISIPEATLEIKGQELNVKTLDTETEIKDKSVDVEGSPTKYKLPTIKFPKFTSTPKASSTTSKLPTGGIAPEKEAQIPSIVMKSQNVEVEGYAYEMTVKEAELEGQGNTKVEMSEMGGKDADMNISRRTISLPKFGFTKSEIKTSETDVKKDGLFPEATVDITEAEIKDKTVDVGGSPSKYKLPTIKLPKFGTSTSKASAEASTSQIGVTAQDIPSGTTNIEVKAEMSEVEIKSPDVKTDIPTKGSPSKFKLPAIKLPKFGIAVQKNKTEGFESGAEIPVADTKAKLDTTGGNIGTAIDQNIVTELNVDTTNISTEKIEPSITSDTGDIEASTPETNVKSFTSPSKLKLPTIKLPKFGFQKTKPSDSNVEIIQKNTDSNEALPLEGEKTNYKSSDVSKEKMLGFNILLPKEQSSPNKEQSGGQPSHDGLGQGETESNAADKSVQVKKESTEKSSKINLPAFGDIFKGFDLEFHVPTLDEVEKSLTTSREDISVPAEEVSVQEIKSTKEHPAQGLTPTPVMPVEMKEMEDPEMKIEKDSWFKFPKFGISSPSKVTREPTEDADKNPEEDAVEDDFSLTESVRSSDVFADISSTMTSEHIGPSEMSPTKVKVKYSEPGVLVGVSEFKLPTEVISSAARSEVFLIDHDLPKTIVTSMIDTKRTEAEPYLKASDDENNIKIITSNIQAIPGTEHATVITKFESHTVQSVTPQKMTVSSGSWIIEESMESTEESSEKHVTVEKHVVKEKLVDDRETVVITQKVTCVASGELVVDDTASAIRKLKDTVHSEKMKFFEEAKAVGTQRIETHVLDSTPETKGEKNTKF